MIIHLKKILIFSLFFSPLVHSRLLIDIKIVHKRGIDKKLTLVSELHSVEEISGSEVNLKMKKGVQLKLVANLKEDYSQYGPSAQVFALGTLYDRDGQLLKKFKKNFLLDQNQKSTQIVYKGEDEEVNIYLIPKLK